MKPFKQTLYFLLSFVLIIACNTKQKKAEKPETYTALATSSSSCLAKSSWFTIDPSTNKRKTPAPAEDSTSVFGNNETVSNCDFHQWSWQKFLWLTNDESGTPLFINELIQVDNQNTPVGLPNDKTIVLSSSDNVQASGNVLKSNKDFSTDSTSYDVYYSIHVDSSLYTTTNKYASKPKSQYTEVTFPVGALELKVAWIDAKAIKDTSSYYVTDIMLEGTKTPMALLGMHVVGIVYNHPEFVWATFEHEDLVPYYDWTSTTTSDVPVTSSTNKLFFNKNATGTIDNLNHTNDSINMFAVNKYGVPRQAQNTFLKTTSQKEPANYNHIDEINASVKSQLTDIWKNYFYNGSIWVNTEGYSYPTEQAQLLNSLGNNLHIPDSTSLLRGSVAAYNITMETYEQLGFSIPSAIHEQSVNTIGNCFTCHSSDGSPLTFSHVFNGAVHKASTGASRKQTKQKHLNEITEFIKKMK